jgi:hypothetical protein
MAKPQRTIQCLRTYKESEIKNLGNNIYWKRHPVLLIATVVIALAIAFGVMQLFPENDWAVLGMIPLFAWFLWWFVFAPTKIGNRLWNAVKDLEQPVDLDRYIDATTKKK